MKIAKCTWNPVADAQGYNVYLNGAKHNTELIAGTTYFIGGVESGVEHHAYATAVYEGIESGESEIAVFTIVELFCDASAMAMSTDVFIMEDNGDFADLYVRKRDEEGALLDEVLLDFSSQLGNTRFAGVSPAEDVFYMIRRNGNVYAFDQSGDVLYEYDAGANDVDEEPDGYGSSVARDGRIAMHNTRSWSENALQVLNPDFSLDYSRTFWDLPAESQPVGCRNVIFDACGNLFAHSTHELVILNAAYEELYSINRDDLFGTSIFSIAIAEEKLYGFSFRLDGEIHVALFDLNEFSHEIIGTITTSDDPASHLHEFASVDEQSSTVDGEGNCWFVGRVPDHGGMAWLGLGRITPHGAVKVWRLYDTGATGGTPFVRSLYYSHPGNKLLISIGGTLSVPRPTLIVDIDAQDEQADEIVVQTTIPGDERTNGARFAPGEYSVLKGAVE